jgi:hypothetical protein
MQTVMGTPHVPEGELDENRESAGAAVGGDGGVALVVYLGTQANRENNTVTGCLQKGDKPDEDSILDASGKNGLRSSTVQLGDHLSHKVMVTGETNEERGEKARTRRG